MRDVRIHVAGTRPVDVNIQLVHTEPSRLIFADLRGAPLAYDLIVTISETSDGTALHELMGRGAVEVQPYHTPELAEGRVYYFNAWRQGEGFNATLISRGTITQGRAIGPSGAPGHYAFVTPDGEVITAPDGAIYLEKSL